MICSTITHTKRCTIKKTPTIGQSSTMLPKYHICCIVTNVCTSDLHAHTSSCHLRSHLQFINLTTPDVPGLYTCMTTVTHAHIQWVNTPHSTNVPSVCSDHGWRRWPDFNIKRHLFYIQLKWPQEHWTIHTWMHLTMDRVSMISRILHISVLPSNTVDIYTLTLGHRYACFNWRINALRESLLFGTPTGGCTALERHLHRPWAASAWV